MRWHRTLCEAVKAWRSQSTPTSGTFETWGTGPAPILAVNGGKGRDQFQPLVEQLQWDCGVLFTSPSKQQELQTTASASDAIKSILDERRIDFAHCLVHSWGAHVALRMGYDYIDRVGCLVVLDTPVTSLSHQEEFRINKALQHMKRDPNLSPEEVKSVADQLPQVQKLPLDQLDDGLPDASEMDMEELFLVQQPMCLIRPESGAWMDDDHVQAHKKAFNVREEIVIKGCTSHEDLFSKKHAAAVAKAVDDFLNRYDTHHVVSAKFEKLRLQDEARNFAVRSTASAESKAAAKVQEEAEEKEKAKKSKKVSKRGKKVSAKGSKGIGKAEVPQLEEGNAAPKEV